MVQTYPLNYYPSTKPNPKHYQTSQFRLLSTNITISCISIKIMVSMIKKDENFQNFVLFASPTQKKLKFSSNFLLH